MITQEKRNLNPKAAPPGAQRLIMTWGSIWGPVAILVVAIFISSAQPKYAPPPGTTPEVYLSGAMPVFQGNWEILLKKGAHIMVYGLLAGALLRGLARTGLRPRRTVYLALLLTMAYALFDEYHQSFVPGRNGSLRDLGFDFVGAAFTSLAGHQLLRRRQTRQPPPADC